MKKIITTIAVCAFALIGTTIDAEARPHGGHGYNSSSGHAYVSGYRHGRPVYTQKYIAGYDCHGHPIYRYRTVAAPRSNYRSNCNTGYRKSGYSRNTYNSYGNQYGSRVRVSYSSCR